MSEEEQQPQAPEQDIGSVFSDDDRKLRELAKMYENMPLSERIKKTINGLSAPKDSGEYKFAKLQLQRSSGPILAILVPLVAICILLSIQKSTDGRQRTQQVEILEVEDAPEIEEPPEPPEEVEFLDPVDVDIDGPSGDPTFENVMDVTDSPVSPKPAEMNSVAQIDSPIVLKGILGSRNPGQRGAALGKWGVGGGDAIVMRALRWLKTKQNADGSWGNNGNNYTSMTSLAILTYLAHGETPSDSVEFGETVNKAIQFLIDSQNKDSGYFRNKDGNNYSHPMAVYALSEAFSMTRNPVIKEAAEAACVPLIKGQYKNGAWAYNMRDNQNYPVGDCSYAGWCAQAIKAAHTAELEVDGLEECYQRAKHGFDDFFAYEGGFGYNGPAMRGLTPVGALCMQLLGEWADQKVAKAMDTMKNCTYDFEHWENQPWSAGGNPSPVYYWYYLTQAKFQVGGATFKDWNAKFYPELKKRQVIIEKDKSGYQDAKGEYRDIGYWDSPSKGESHHEAGSGDLDCTYFAGGVATPGKTTINRRVMDTCLSALQLMVYYRFLPASQSVTGENVLPEPKKKKKAGEVTVGIKKKAKT